MLFSTEPVGAAAGIIRQMVRLAGVLVFDRPTLYSFARIGTVLL